MSAELRPRVLLTATNWWPGPARLAMALTSAGCRVWALCPRRGHPLQKTRAVEGVYVYNALRPLRAIQAAIEQSRPDLIVPCDDPAVAHLHELHRDASAHGGRTAVCDLIERSLGSSHSFSILASRTGLMQIAREERLRIPATAGVCEAADFARWGKDHPFPWVVKTDGSWGGHGTRIVESEADAVGAFESMSQPLNAARAVKRLMVNRDPYWMRPWRQGGRPKVSVQAYVRGYPANRAAFCWKGRVLAGLSVDVVGSLTATGSAAVVRVVDRPQMTEASERLARRLNLSGFYGFDFMVEESTRDAYLIEVNPRSTQLCHLNIAGRDDLAAGLYGALSGTPAGRSLPATHKDLIAYFPQAWLSSPESRFLHEGYHDVPWQEPDLIRELMRLPWPDRSLLARWSDRFRSQSYADRGERVCVFPDALADPAPRGVAEMGTGTEFGVRAETGRARAAGVGMPTRG